VKYIVVADRTTTTLGVTVAVRDQMTAYRKALRRDCGRKGSTDEILGALLAGVPLWQAAFMLDAYQQQKAREGEPDEDDE
jgi:hypothetical protein